MAVSSRELGPWTSSILAVLMLGSCATGPGEGSAVGRVSAPDCDIANLSDGIYLNETCPFLSRIPVVYRAVSGTIRFDDLFVFWIENDNRLTSAEFTDVELVDTSDPENRRAVLSGDISFLFQRGMPAQNF